MSRTLNWTSNLPTTSKLQAEELKKCDSAELKCWERMLWNLKQQRIYTSFICTSETPKSLLFLGFPPGMKISDTYICKIYKQKKTISEILCVADAFKDTRLTFCLKFGSFYLIWFQYLTYSCVSLRSTGLQSPPHRTLFWAAFFDCFHVLPVSSASLMTELVHVCLGLTN